MRPDRRDPVTRASHIVREPGDRRVGCGARSEDVPTTWARWIGAVEVGHMTTGFPLPAWCPDCLLALHPVATRQATLFDSQR